MGHLQVVTGISDQLYRNAWNVLVEFWGSGGGSRSHNRNYESQPEDGPDIGPKHVVVIILL